MSHFSLIACLPAGTEDVHGELAARLAPYDENKEVDPYKTFEETSPENFWWVTSFRRSAEEVANDDRSSIKPYKPNEFGWSTAWSKNTEEEQWESIKREAEVYNSLPKPLDWESVVKAYNRYYCEGEPYSDGERLNYDPETGGAFTWTTYNPDSKWDWYVVGGRWTGYFPGKLGSAVGIPAERHWSDENRDVAGRLNGGPKWVLDLDALRDEKGKEAAEDYDSYHEEFGHLPLPKPWKHYLELVDQEFLSINQARELYVEQARVRATRDHEDYKWRFTLDHEKYQRPREVVVQEARDHAVPGYALLTKDEVWVAPGHMGMFGMSTDTDSEMDAYKAQANEYIDNLDDDDILVIVDLHI